MKYLELLDIVYDDLYKNNSDFRCLSLDAQGDFVIGFTIEIANKIKELDENDRKN